MGTGDMVADPKGVGQNGDYGKYFFGGPVLDMGVIHEAPVKNAGRTDPTQWAWSFAKTDRIRPRVPWVGCDVHHWYFLQTSYAWKVPRPFDEGYVEGDTGTSWCDLVRDDKGKVNRAKRAQVLAAHCESTLRKGDQDIWWLTLQEPRWTYGRPRTR